MSKLLDLLRDALTPEALDSLALASGAERSATGAAMALVLPTLLGAVSSHVEAGGAGDLPAMIADSTGAGNPLDSLANSLEDPAARERMAGQGTFRLGELLGGQSGPVAAALAGASGLPGATVHNLMHLAMPMVLGAIAKLAGPGAGPAAITALFAEEKPAIAAALPAGMDDLLRPLSVAGPALAGTQLEGAAEAAKKTGWLPWALAAVLAIGLVIGLRNCDGETAKDPAAPAAAPPVEAATDSDLIEVPLADGNVLVVRAGTVGGALARFLQSSEPAPREFRFDELSYDSASDRLDADSERTVNSIAAILAAYPGTRVTIEGHTDSEGDDAANLALSQRRADRVEAIIEARGIADDRVDSAGLGETRPAASNDTPEGRLENRRTVIVVTAR